MVCPASTLSPAATLTVTTPANGAATWSGLDRSAFSAVGHVAGDAAVAHHHRPQLAVEDAHHGAHAALVGIGDRLQPDQQLDAALELHAVLVAVPQPVEELVGRQAARCRRTARGGPRIPLSDRGTAAGSASAWRFGPGCASAASSSAVSSWVGLAGGRPASALVRNGSGQPPGGSPSSPRRNPITESGMSNRAGSAANSSALTPAPDQRQRQVADHLRRRRHLHQPAQHPVGAGVVASSISSNRSPSPSAMACWRRFDSWPPGISW